MERARGLGPVVLVATVVLAALLLALPARLIADEVVHVAQAQAFASGNWRIYPYLSTWPTLNVIVAAPLALLGSESLTAARATVASLALLAIVGFYLLAAHFDRQSAALRTAQFFLLPIVLPYCGLVYTDIPALAAILWMFYGALTQRFAMFAVAAVLAIALRQTNIVWFAAGLASYAYTLHGSAPTRSARQRVPLAALALGVILGWTATVWYRGGIALTPETQAVHGFGLAGLPNIEFAIGLGGALFLPILASTSARFSEAMRRPRWAILFAGILLFVGVTFAAEHPYNADPAVIDEFLHNRLLYEIAQPPPRWVFALVVAVAAFGFALLPVVERAGSFKIPLYAFGAASLLPISLIEQRYYLPLFALVWAIRAPASAPLERTQLALNILLTIAVLVAMARSAIFL